MMQAKWAKWFTEDREEMLDDARSFGEMFREDWSMKKYDRKDADFNRKLELAFLSGVLDKEVK